MSSTLTLIILTLTIFLFQPSLCGIMGEHVLDWLREKAVGWSHTPPVNKIDTHHHFVPPFYAQGKIQSFGVHKSSQLTRLQPWKNKGATPVAGPLPAGTL